MSVDLILGPQWGDEGKGKIVDVLTDHYDIVARFQGGPNAGHTLVFNGSKHVLNTIPSGIFHERITNVIGNGVVIDPVSFIKEIDLLKEKQVDCQQRLLISKKAHLILPTHRLLDAASETAKGKTKIGSTLRGIGPAYMDKTGRNGLRVGDLITDGWQEKYTSLVEKHLQLINLYDVDMSYDLEALQAEFYKAVAQLKELSLIDSENYLNNALKQGKKILAEGAQGTMLDVDFGSYPYVTSSNTSAAGACTGLGISPNKINRVVGIFKAYCTRVGSGPFPTELFGDEGAYLGKKGNEFGSITNRPRRCGWLDLVALKYAAQINGITELAIMKSDVLSTMPEIKACVAYKVNGVETDAFPYEIDQVESVYKTFKGWDEDLTLVEDYASLPQSFKDYIGFIESYLDIPIKMVSVGPDRLQTFIL